MFVTPPFWLMNTLGAFFIVNPDTVMSEPPLTKNVVARARDESAANASYAAWPLPSMTPLPVSDRNLAPEIPFSWIMAV